MIWTIFVILVLLWLLGLVTSYTMGRAGAVGGPPMQGDVIQEVNRQGIFGVIGEHVLMGLEKTAGRR
jgi:hypothetical protein